MSDRAPPPAASPLLPLARVFLTLGATAFGGPAAHVALMERELVRRRGWLTREEFLDLLGAANLIPGPTSTEVAIHVGHRRAGIPGLLVAGACFILPAALLVAALAALYERAGALPALDGVLRGMKPVAVAVVAHALVGFVRAALRTRLLLAVALFTAVASGLGAPALAVLLAAGLLTGAVRAGPPSAAALLPLVPLGALAPSSTPPPGAGASLLAIFATFLKLGAMVFGSGYVLLAFLRDDLVVRLGWLTEAQLLDAVAVGQITPGPVFTAATFIGWLVAGAPGAAVATIAVFLPAFLFVALSGPILPRVRRSPVAGAFLDGVNAASVALMAVVTWQLGRAAIGDVATALIALATAALLLRTRVNAAWLFAAGAAAGLLLP